MVLMTNLISEVKAALQAATPGPWTKWERNDGIQVVEKDGELSICDMDGGSWQEWLDNAHLIANSPTWLQQLTDRLEEAVKALEWYGSMEKYKDVYQPTGIKKCTKQIENDNGYLARTTLKRIKGENG
jgi:hypothetical protein